MRFGSARPPAAAVALMPATGRRGWGGPPRCTASEGEWPWAGGGSGAPPRLRARGSPPAVGDGAEATAHQSANGQVQEGEETKGNHSTGLIGGWLGVELAVVRGPATTSTAETEQSFTIPQLKG